MRAESERFGGSLIREDVFTGSRVLVGSKSGRFGGSLRREFDFRVVGRWWEESHSVLVGRFCEKVVLGSRDSCVWWEQSRSILVARFGAKLIFGTLCVGGIKVTGPWRAHSEHAVFVDPVT